MTANHMLTMLHAIVIDCPAIPAGACRIAQSKVLRGAHNATSTWPCDPCLPWCALSRTLSRRDALGAAQASTVSGPSSSKAATPGGAALLSERRGIAFKRHCF